MNSSPNTVEVVRQHAESLLTSIGVSRIVVVDDEYSSAQPEVEELLGICTSLPATESVVLPHLEGIDFEADREIWAGQVRERWETLDGRRRREVLERARAIEEPAEPEASPGAIGEEGAQPPAVTEAEEGAAVGPGLESHTITGTPAPSASALPVDTRAATSLEELLSDLPGCTLVTLSLHEWRERAEELLGDESAATTVFLFDRDFGREEKGAENEGFRLVRNVQQRGVGFCGLITHKVQRDGEQEAWGQLAAQHNLVRDRFVVIAKERLTSDSPDHYGFLRMLRLVALSGCCATLKTSAWKVFEESVAEAKATVERLSVLDFDKIVLSSSRREGVWEPDTLFRAFGILMRRAARQRMHMDRNIPTAVSDARRISAIPENVAPSLGEERPSREALRIQRFETYESNDILNPFCLPTELGDIFERPSTRRRYVLLAQPCDLMVRMNGKRSYDDKFGRTGALVRIVEARGHNGEKESRCELPFYYEDTGAPAYADFAGAHQVQLSVLDLCALREDGVAEVEIGASCPDLVTEPWKERYERLQKLFETALRRYQELQAKQVEAKLSLLALPALSTTLPFQAEVKGDTIRYDLTRVLRLRQPWAGALLTAFAQYQARTAFEHPFEHQVPLAGGGIGDPGPHETAGVDAPE